MPVFSKSLFNIPLLLPAVLLLACGESGDRTLNGARTGEVQLVATLTGEALYASDKAPDSMLYDLPREVMDGVWSAIGSLGPRTYENSGHNNNLSFVVTDEGVLVINAGDNYLLARALHEEIRKITDRPVRYVILENARGHAILGAGYWQEQGATIVAHEDTARAIAENAYDILHQMKHRLGDKAEGTSVVRPDKTFRDRMAIKLGGEHFELIYPGPSHSPGDIVVWMPEKRLAITGDIAFHQRLLPLFEYTDTAAWIESWGALAALDAELVIPGHGAPTSMEEVTRTTLDYLVQLRKKVAEVVENGGTLQDAYEIDQSAYAHLPTFEFLARRNAGRVYQEMEFIE